MTSNPTPQAETLIGRIIGVSSRNAFLVIILTLFGAAGGIYALTQIPLDAIPDQSDVQVIVYTDWEGRSPDLVEDPNYLPDLDQVHRGAKGEVCSRGIDVWQVLCVRDFPGWNGHLLGPFPDDRIPELCPGFAS
jgi:hypothetical protein